MSLKLLVLIFPLLTTLYPAYADALDCVSVERTENRNGALTVWVRNGCIRSIAAVSLLPLAADLPAQTATEVDFTVGIGLPDALAVRLPPGTSLGLFVPGSTRAVSASVPITSAPVQIQATGVLFANGDELGDATSLRALKRLWRYRLLEYEGLELHLKSLREAQAGGQDELDSLPYIKNRMKQLRKERDAPGATRVEVRERTAGEMDLNFLDQLITNLNLAVTNGAMSRASAQTLFREILSSRLNANRSFVAGLK
jgi:hypothetical protein